MAPRLKAGDKAPPIIVLDIHGQPTPIAPYWASGPTLMTFLRHFGWMHCRNRLAQLELHKDELKAAGLQLIALGLGKPEHAERYCGTLAPSHACFADTTNDSYYAWGLRQGTLTEGLANSINILRASAKASRNGHVQAKSTGDVHMLPGTFIVDTNGIIRYAYYSHYAGDDPEIAELVAVVHSLQSDVV